MIYVNRKTRPLQFQLRAFLPPFAMPLNGCAGFDNCDGHLFEMHVVELK